MKKEKTISSAEIGERIQNLRARSSELTLMRDKAAEEEDRPLFDRMTQELVQLSADIIFADGQERTAIQRERRERERESQAENEAREQKRDMFIAELLSHASEADKHLAAAASALRSIRASAYDLTAVTGATREIANRLLIRGLLFERCAAFHGLADFFRIPHMSTQRSQSLENHLRDLFPEASEQIAG